MKGSNIISSIHHLKMSHEHLEDFRREHPFTKGAMLFAQYQKRMEWIYKDMITHPFLTPLVRDGIKREWNSDTFATTAIAEKVALLTPEQRDAIEALIDQMLKGETIQVEKL
jgi:hypothetical protein